MEEDLSIPVNVVEAALVVPVEQVLDEPWYGWEDQGPPTYFPVDAQPLRRSYHIQNRQDRFLTAQQLLGLESVTASELLISEATISVEPQSFEEALSGPGTALWKVSIQKRICQSHREKDMGSSPTPTRPHHSQE